MQRKRWLIGLAVVVILLVLFRDAPLVRAMWNLAGAIADLFGALFGLLLRSIAAV